MIGYQIISGGKRSKQNSKKKEQCEECGKQKVLVATALCTCGQQVCKSCHKKKVSRGGCQICSLSSELSMKGDIRVHEIEVEVAGSKKLLLSINPPSEIDIESEDREVDYDQSQDTDVETESLKKEILKPLAKSNSNNRAKKQKLHLKNSSPRHICSREIQHLAREPVQQENQEHAETTTQNHNKGLKLETHSYNYQECYEGDRVVNIPPKNYDLSPIRRPAHQFKSAWSNSDLSGLFSELRSNQHVKNTIQKQFKIDPKESCGIFATLEKLFREQDEIDDFFARIQTILDSATNLSKTCSHNSDDLGFVGSDIDNLPFSLDEQLSEKLPDENALNNLDDWENTTYNEDQNQNQQNFEEDQQYEEEEQKEEKIQEEQQNFQQMEQQVEQPHQCDFQPQEIPPEKQIAAPFQLSPTSISYYQHQQYQLQQQQIQQQINWQQKQVMQPKFVLPPPIFSWGFSQPPPVVPYHFVPRYCSFDPQGYVWFFEPMMHAQYVVHDSRFFPSFAHQI